MFMKVILMAFIVLLCSSTAYGAQIIKVQLKEYTPFLIHQKKGENIYQAKKRSGADIIFGGGYFEPSTYRLIDLVIVQGKTLKDYRWDWARPILLFKGATASILRPKKGVNPKIDADYAMACDYKTTHRYLQIGRQVIGLKNGYLYCISTWGTESHTRKFLIKIGIVDFVFLDGGSSFWPTSRVPIHTGFKKNKPAVSKPKAGVKLKT
jgi:hypothetical protein